MPVTNNASANKRNLSGQYMVGGLRKKNAMKDKDKLSTHLLDNIAVPMATRIMPAIISILAIILLSTFMVFIVSHR